MNILHDFKVITVTPVREKAGEGLGDIRIALTLEATMSANEAALMMPTERDKIAFPKKYWHEDGTLLIAGIADASTIDREIMGGNVSIVPGGGYSDPMAFEGADIKNIRFIAEPGHRCKLKLAAHVKPGDDEQCGRLVNLHSTEITLTASRSKADAEKEAAAKRAADAQGDLLAAAQQEAHHEDGPTLEESLQQANINQTIDKEAADRKNPGAIDAMRKDEQEDIAREAARAKGETPPKRIPGQPQRPKGTH